MSRRTLYGLLGLTALAALARFATLDLQSFHHDEAVTAGQVLSPNLGETLDQVADGERSPPLYYVLAWGWSTVFGTGEVGLRSLSALIGMLMVSAAFFAGQALASDRVGLAAALLFALNPYLVWYSQEARSYILMTLFATVAVGALAARERRPDQRSTWLWAAASALAFVSHYFAIFLIVPQAIWLLARERERRLSVPPVAAVALVGLALVPLALIQQGSERREGFAERPVLERVGEVGLNYVASEDPDPLSGGPQVDAVQIGAGAAGLALLALATFLLVACRHREDAGEELVRTGALRLAALSLVVVATPALIALAGLDLVNPRNLLAGVVPVLLGGALVFGGLRGRIPALGLAATAALFAAVVLAVNLSSEMHREDWRGAAEAMGEPGGVRLIVAPKNGDDPLELYLGAEKFEGKRFDGGVEAEEVKVLSTSAPLAVPKVLEPVGSIRLPPLFQLASFRPEDGVRIAPDDLAGIVGGRSVTLIQRP